MLKKGDAVIFTVLVCMALVFAGIFMFFKNPGKQVVVKQNNKVVYTCALNKDNCFALEGNTVCIKDGYVYMKDATCKNQICVHHKKISEKGETIVCLPHKVIVEVQ